MPAAVEVVHRLHSQQDREVDPGLIFGTAQVQIQLVDEPLRHVARLDQQQLALQALLVRRQLAEKLGDLGRELGLPVVMTARGSDAAAMAQLIRAAGVVPELEIFDSGDMAWIGVPVRR